MKMWPIRFVEGSQPGKRKKDDVGRKNVSEREKRARYEQEKHPERTFNDKWHLFFSSQVENPQQI
jgi:hypothetical protein